MKILKSEQFVSEKMKIIPITNDELDKANEKSYKYYPKTKEELKSIINERIENEGNNCDLNDIYTRNITDMSHMFNGVEFFNGDISKWDVSNVKDMRGMFYFAESFNGDISEWNVSNVENMLDMFIDCPLSKYPKKQPKF